MFVCCCQDLFERMGVLSPGECQARESVLLLHYVGTVEIEVKCMIDMMNQHILPSMRSSQLKNEEAIVAELSHGVKTLQLAWEAIHRAEGLDLKAAMCRVLRLETMEEVRGLCDAAEGLCPAHLWTLGTYKDMLFMDQA
jgi:glutamine synthetase